MTYLGTMDLNRTQTPPFGSIEALRRGIEAGERAALARGITLIESRQTAHRAQAQALLQHVLQCVLPHRSEATRVGISGPPGVGKSTFIEALGVLLLSRGHRVAVLAIDPSSSRSGGSILGDKTRMARLANEENAFIRPSPSGGQLGGVARHTQEALLLLEAAGFDVILVETVGAGQNETLVVEMVDTYLVLVLPGAGDTLQGMKKGMIELADLIVVNKADGNMTLAAEAAEAHYRQALHILTPRSAHWRVPVRLCSSVEERGLAAVWQSIGEHRRSLQVDDALRSRRQAQQVRWMERLLEVRLQEGFWAHPAVKQRRASVEEEVRQGRLPPSLGAEELLRAWQAHADPLADPLAEA